MQYPWSRPGRSRDKHRGTVASSDELFRREFTEAIDSHQKQSVSKKSKRFRSAFTTDQINYLEMEFQKFPYIGNAQRKEVANFLKIPERAVKIWFQNRRMKEKKDLVGNTESYEPSDRKTIDLVKDKGKNSTLSMPPISAPSSTLPEPEVAPSVHHVAHIDLSNFEPDSGNMPDPRNMNFYNDSISTPPEVSISRIPKSQPARPLSVNNPPFKYRSSAEFSIDLCKKYKTFEVAELQSKTEDISLHPLGATPPNEFSLGKVRKFEYQISPEDLSCNKPSAAKIKTPSPPRQVNPATPGLIPVYVNYPQPYFSTGNMLWKPVNVMPIMSTGLPAVNSPSIPCGPLQRAQEQSTVKKTCNCDCHSDTVTDARSNPQAQYVLTALPFANYHKF